MKKTLTKTLSGFMALALTLVIAGCASGKAGISPSSACEAFNKYGAMEITEFDDFTVIFNNRSLEAEGGYFYTSIDEEETEFIAEYIIFRFQDIPDWNYQECSYFVATSKEDGSMAGSYILVFNDEKDAKEVFDYISEDLSYEDNYSSGSKSGVDYSVCREEGTKQQIECVYRQGKSVFYLKAFASELDALKEYDNIIKNMGLVSPLSK